MTAEQFMGRRPYGALELKRSYQQGLARALAAAALLHVAVLWGALQWAAPGAEDAGRERPAKRHTIDVRPLPPVTMEPQPIPVDPRAGFKARARQEIDRGKLVPKPDNEVKSESLLPTRIEVSALVNGRTEADSTALPGVPGGVEEDWDPETWIPPLDSFIVYVRDPAPLPGQPQPVYPELARVAGVDGIVRLAILVGPRGEVLEVRWLGKPGSVSPLLVDAAMEAVRQWQFIPAVQQDRNVASWFKQAIVFRLR